VEWLTRSEKLHPQHLFATPTGLVKYLRVRIPVATLL
jgi:hypothetical protein